MSRAVMQAGYSIRALHGGSGDREQPFVWENATNHKENPLPAGCHDIWNEDDLSDRLSPANALFWKVSRARWWKNWSQFPPEVAEHAEQMRQLRVVP